MDIMVQVNIDMGSCKPKVLWNQIKKDLKQVYPNNTIAIDTPCVSVQFKSCIFELMPVVQQRGKYYHSLNGATWQPIINPFQLSKTLKQCNGANGGQVTGVIQLLKHVKRKLNRRKPLSFQIEQQVIHTFNSNRKLDTRNAFTLALQRLNWITITECKKMIKMPEQEFIAYCKKQFFKIC